MRRLWVYQVIVILMLFVSAVGVLWSTVANATDRAARRRESIAALRRADDALARGGARGLALVPDWPDTLSAAEWSALDDWLREQARAALRPFHGNPIEGGYYIPSESRHLGRAVSPSGARGGGPTIAPKSSEPPEAELEIVDAQIHDALDRERPVEIVVERPTGSIALRTGPVWVNERKVAATWALSRLDSAASAARDARGYRLAAGLALAGTVVALALTAHLALAVRRHGRDRERLQLELRRGERLAALGKLLAGVAHEVRNPLAGIRSTAQLWQHGFAADRESIQDMVAEVDRLDRIVARLLQFSRAEDQSRAPGDVNSVVSEAARLARKQADESAVAITLDLAGDLPAVPMTATAVLQVLRNLTANGLQAMPAGGTLRLSTRWDAAHERVEVSVSDTGEGLSESARAHLFEPFHTTKPDGTGLGLAIAREIALGHGGDLCAGPINGRPGAVFTLTLPVAAKVGSARS